MQMYPIAGRGALPRIKRLFWFATAAALGLCSSIAGAADIQLAGSASLRPTLTAVAPNTFAMTHETTFQEVLAHADSETMVSAEGKRISVARLRQANALTQRYVANRSRLPRVKFIAVNKTAAAQKIGPNTDLAALLNQPDDTPLETPSGKRFNVSVLKILQPEIERRIGRPINQLRSSAGGRAAIYAPGLATQKVPTKPKIADLLKQPDSQVLESPHGIRITVGELRHYLATHPATAAPGKRSALDATTNEVIAWTDQLESELLMDMRHATSGLSNFDIISSAHADTAGDISSVIDTIANILDDVGAGNLPGGFPTGDELRGVKNVLLDCVLPDTANANACANDAKSAGDAEGLPSYFGKIVDCITDIINADYLQLLVDAGEAFLCAAAASFMGGLDICGVLGDVVAVAEGIYDAAKAVVDFFDDVGCAIETCESEANSHLTGPQAEQQYYAPHLKEAVGIIETCTDASCKAFDDWLTQLESSFPDWVPYVGDTNNPYDYQGAPQVSAHQLFMDNVTGAWTLDITSKLLSSINGASNKLDAQRNSYEKQTLQNVSSDVKAADVTPQACMAWFKSPDNAARNYDYWFYYGQFNNKAAVDAQRAPLQSNEHWCTYTFYPATHQNVASGVAQHYVDLGCPLQSGSQVCATAADLKNCEAFTASLPTDVKGIHIGPVCVMAKAAVDADMAKLGCPASNDLYACTSMAAYASCQAYAKQNGLPGGTNPMQCHIAPEVVANEVLVGLNAGKPGSCSLGNAPSMPGAQPQRSSSARSLAITCKRDLKWTHCQNIVGSTGAPVACLLDRPLDPPYNEKYNYVSGLLQGKIPVPPEQAAASTSGKMSMSNKSAPIAQMALPSPAQWKRVDQDPLVVLVPSGVTLALASHGGGASNPQANPSNAAMQALQQRLDAYAAQVYPGHADACHSEPDTEDDGQEMFQLCATYGVVPAGGPTIPQMSNGMAHDQANTTSASALYGASVPTPASAGSFANGISDGGGFKQNLQSATQQSQMLQANKATAANGSALAPSVANGAALAGAGATAGFGQQQSQTLSATLPKGSGPPLPPPSRPTGSGAGVATMSTSAAGGAIRLDSVSAQVTAASSPAVRSVAVKPEGAVVACPAELTISAAALIPQAGPLTFESYLLAPDGSKQNWVHSVPLVAQPPLPYRAPTHGSFVLASGSIDRTLTLVINLGINGQNVHLEAPQHFQVSCANHR